MYTKWSNIDETYKKLEKKYRKIKEVYKLGTI